MRSRRRRRLPQTGQQVWIAGRQAAFRYACGSNGAVVHYLDESDTRVVPLAKVSLTAPDDEPVRRDTCHLRRPVAPGYLEEMANRSPDVIYRYRLWPVRGFDYVNEAVTRVVGYTPAELYADPDLGPNTIHPEDRCVGNERLSLGPVPATVVLRWVRKDGRTIWMEMSESPVLSRSGRLIAIEGIARQLRNPARDPDPKIRLVDGVRIDLVGQTVHVDGRLVSLSPTEFKLLALLTSQPGKVFSRQELMRQLWHTPYTGDARTCETYVSTLRKKIERDPRFPERIITVRRRGYRYAGT